MNDSAHGFTDQDLSDYLDGRIEPERALKLEAALAADPELNARFEDFSAQHELLGRLGLEILEEPVPKRLLKAAHPRSQRDWMTIVLPRWGWPQFAAAAAFLAIGLCGGWFGHSYVTAQAGLLQPYVEQAVLAHRLLESDKAMKSVTGKTVRKPLGEVSYPFASPVRAPALLGTTFRPIAARSQVGDSGAGVQIAYENEDGRITTLYVRQQSALDRLPVEFAEEDGYSVLYWLDGPLMYALVGENESEDDLRKLALSVYSAPAVGGQPKWDAEQGEIKRLPVAK